MLQELVLHGVKSLKYNTEEAIYVVIYTDGSEETKIAHLDGFVDQVSFQDSEHCTVVFSVNYDD